MRGWDTAGRKRGFIRPIPHYFAVSKIGRDQLEDWARRTGMTVAEAERWLAPLL